jgi:hypothetical protein
MKRSILIGVFVILLLAIAPPRAAAEQGTASGNLTLGGKTTPLTNAYALARPDTFDKTKENVLIVLSDVPISEDSLWEDFPGLKMGAAGRLHAVEVEVRSDKSVKAGGVVDASFVDSQGYYGMENPEVQLTTFDTKTVEGKLFTAKPQELMKKKFEFTATFRAPILHRPAPTASGAAASETAPARVVLAFLKAAAAGDKAAIRKLLTAEYGKPLDGPRGKDILNQWKTNHPDPATTEIGSVDIRGTSAEVVMVNKSKDGGMAAKFTLVLDGGQWRIDGAMM